MLLKIRTGFGAAALNPTLCVPYNPFGQLNGPAAMAYSFGTFTTKDRLTQQVFGNPPGTWSRPTAMPMDAYRVGDEFVVAFDLPGVLPDAIELDVERNVLNVRAERRSPAPEGAEMIVAERPTGSFTRQLFLGDTLDTDHIDASYDSGVLTLRIPVAPQAKSSNMFTPEQEMVFGDLFVQTNTGRSNYHGATFEVEKRFAAGFGGQLVRYAGELDLVVRPLTNLLADAAGALAARFRRWLYFIRVR